LQIAQLTRERDKLRVELGKAQLVIEVQRKVAAHLYVILDIFSRFVVGWLIAPRECSQMAQQLIADPTSATTTRTPSRSSRLGSKGSSSQGASAASSTPAPTAKPSSPGTTTSTATAASRM